MDGIKNTCNMELQQKAVRAVKMFAERSGDEVIDTGFDSMAGGIDLVTRDEYGTIRFVVVRVRRFGLANPVEVNGRLRRTLEARAVAWLGLHREIADTMLCFDFADVGVVGPDRAILRYHRGILEAPCNSDDLIARGEMRALGIPVDDDAEEEPTETLAEDLAAAEADAE